MNTIRVPGVAFDNADLTEAGELGLDPRPLPAGLT
jgi:hypothetical protein